MQIFIIANEIIIINLYYLFYKKIMGPFSIFHINENKKNQIYLFRIFSISILKKKIKKRIWFENFNYIFSIFIFKNTR